MHAERQAGTDGREHVKPVIMLNQFVDSAIVHKTKDTRCIPELNIKCIIYLVV